MNNSPALKRVLFVDDCPVYLENIRRGLTSWTRGKWELVLTHDTSEALTILDRQHIDLVVCDLCMLPMDGMQFLKLAHLRHPHIRKAMLTGFEEAQMCKPALMEACDVYLLKPKTVAGFDTVFHTLNKLFAVPQEGFRGLLRTVSLTDLIQLECLNRRTSILEVTAHNLRGVIYIREGSIIHAIAGSKTGPAAFIRLMKMPGGDFHLKPFTDPQVRTIETVWEHLLMEAAQAADESNDPDAQQEAEDTTWILKEDSGPMTPFDSHHEVEPLETPRHPRAAEVFVVGNDDKTIFAWQCNNPDARVKLLNSIEAKCRDLCTTLSMGAPAFVDFQQSTGRALAHFQSGHRTFSRTEYKDPQTTEAAHA